MKKLAWVLLIICTGGAFSVQSEKKILKTETGTLYVLVKGFKSNIGQLMVALYNCASDFPENEPYKGSISKISRDVELIKFEKVPYGNYAIAVLHDIDNDGKLDKNVWGIPTEGYGFSNNVREKFGPPSFLKARFMFAGWDDEKIIGLEYGIPQ
ncbi:MAG TPA: DUF2141 domain-containing protein [Bacteroidales bacterium]|nr:DUF2141 domain-containing protein [Bacteroidales bacterium]